MFEDTALSFTGQSFVWKGKPIDLIGVRRIRLDLSLSSTLKFPVIDGPDPILFELDFGLGEAFPSMEDMAPFLSLGLGLDAFGNYIDERAIGAVVLSSKSYFSPLVTWDDELINDLGLFFKRLGLVKPNSIHGLQGAERLAVEVFSRDTALGYVSLLASQLPQGIAGLIDITGEGLSPFEREVLLLPSTLSGLHSVDRATITMPTIGILIPELQANFLEQMPAFERVAEELRSHGLSYRLVSAEQFHENWELLDTAIYEPSVLTLSSERQLMGFEAAGGEKIALGAELEAWLQRASMAGAT
jgi:hypothetical protein